MVEKMKVASIQPLGSSALDGAVPLDKVPEDLIARFVGNSFSLQELEAMGVSVKGAHFVLSHGSCRYLLNFASMPPRSDSRSKPAQG
ncbi:MAG: hypothetical protein M1319_00225 [Chloroflexi bacterium]|nr:hypothetical protein [Chloroflexota bacterium]